VGTRSQLAALSIITLALIGAPPVSADGLPVVGIDAGPEGVTSEDGLRYATVPFRRGTLVLGVEQDGGRVAATALLQGRFAIPVVAFDRTTSGVSADGDTLVVIRPRLAFPRRSTTFAILHTRNLARHRVVTLRGDFSFDALSPDGRWLYLVEYVDPGDPTHYAVRVYDIDRGRLTKDPIVDVSEPGEQMRGLPITRQTNSDGRIAYTLYSGAGGNHYPFVHALDTVERTAVCIDLDALQGRRDLYELRLQLTSDGRSFTVTSGGGNTRTYRVSDPIPPVTAGIPEPTVDEPAIAAAPVDRSAASFAPAPGRETDSPWAIVTISAGAAAGLLLTGLAVLRRRRRQPISSTI
jgi:hypothetical protein